jgi:methyltransferase-like protein
VTKKKHSKKYYFSVALLGGYLDATTTKQIHASTSNKNFKGNLRDKFLKTTTLKISSLYITEENIKNSIPFEGTGKRSRKEGEQKRLNKLFVLGKISYLKTV